MPPAAEAPPRADRPSSGSQAPARRTVVIRGQVAPPSGASQPVYGSSTVPARRRPPRRASERIAGTRPDRAALWAVMMGLFLIVVAVATGA